MSMKMKLHWVRDALNNPEDGMSLISIMPLGDRIYKCLFHYSRSDIYTIEKADWTNEELEYSELHKGTLSEMRELF